jgi:hypothetical protein
MSLYQTGPPRPKVMAKAILAPAPVLATGVALFKAEESLLAVGSHRVIDALFVSSLVILPMVVMIALLFLLGSADPTTAIPDLLDGTGMLILPP